MIMEPGAQEVAVATKRQRKSSILTVKKVPLPDEMVAKITGSISSDMWAA